MGLFGKSGLQGFPRGWLFLSGTFSCGCPKGLLGPPPPLHGPATFGYRRGDFRLLPTLSGTLHLGHSPFLSLSLSDAGYTRL